MTYRAGLWMVLTIMLAACGQKGPLYLPDEPAQSSNSQAADQPEDKR